MKSINTLFLNLVQRIKNAVTHSDENLQIAKDYTDAIVASQTELYSGSWTATSSSANGVLLTQTITVPRGYYIVILKVPNISGSQFSIKVAVNNTIPDNSITVAVNHGMSVFMIKLTNETNNIVGASAQSARETFTLLERGGIFAMKIAEVVGGVIANLFATLSRKAVTA